MTFKLAEFSIRVTALLKYLNLALNTRSSGFYLDSSLLMQGVSMMTTLTTDQFSAHYSEWLRYNWVDLYSQIRSHHFDTGWILCHISVVFFPILFKPQKGTLTMFTRAKF